LNTLDFSPNVYEKKVEQGGLGPLPAGVTPPPAFAPPVKLPTSPPVPTPAPEAPDAALARLADLRAKELITEEEYKEKRRTIMERL
jgi:hypothetical protein